MNSYKLLRTVPGMLSIFSKCVLLWLSLSWLSVWGILREQSIWQCLEIFLIVVRRDEEGSCHLVGGDRDAAEHLSMHRMNSYLGESAGPWCPQCWGWQMSLSLGSKQPPFSPVLSQCPFLPFLSPLLLWRIIFSHGFNCKLILRALESTFPALGLCL